MHRLMLALFTALALALVTTAEATSSSPRKLAVYQYSHKLQAKACKNFDKAKRAQDPVVAAGFNGYGDGLQAASNHLKQYQKGSGYKMPSAACPPSVKSSPKKFGFPFKKELKGQADDYCTARSIAKSRTQAGDQTDANYWNHAAKAMKDARKWLGKIFSDQGGKVPALPKC